MKMKSTNLLKKLKNSKKLMTLSERKLKPKMVLNITATLSNNNLMKRNLKTNSLMMTKKLLMTNLMRFSNGWLEILMLNSKNMKLNKKKWKVSGTQSCKESTNPWVDNLVECLVVCLEVCQEVCLEEWAVECLVEWAA